MSVGKCKILLIVVYRYIIRICDVFKLIVYVYMKYTLTYIVINIILYREQKKLFIISKISVKKSVMIQQWMR